AFAALDVPQLGALPPLESAEASRGAPLAHTPKLTRLAYHQISRLPSLGICGGLAPRNALFFQPVGLSLQFHCASQITGLPARSANSRCQAASSRNRRGSFCLPSLMPSVVTTPSPQQPICSG